MKTRFQRDSDIEEICKFTNNGSLLCITIVPEFVVDDVEITSRTIRIPEKEIAPDDFAVIVPLEKKLDKEIRRKGVDSPAVDSVSRKTPAWQFYGVPVIAASDQQILQRPDLSIQ